MLSRELSQFLFPCSCVPAAVLQGTRVLYICVSILYCSDVPFSDRCLLPSHCQDVTVIQRSVAHTLLCHYSYICSNCASDLPSVSQTVDPAFTATTGFHRLEALYFYLNKRNCRMGLWLLLRYDRARGPKGQDPGDLSRLDVLPGGLGFEILRGSWRVCSATLPYWLTSSSSTVVPDKDSFLRGSTLSLPPTLTSPSAVIDTSHTHKVSAEIAILGCYVQRLFLGARPSPSHHRRPARFAGRLHLRTLTLSLTQENSEHPQLGLIDYLLVRGPIDLVPTRRRYRQCI